MTGPLRRGSPTIPEIESLRGLAIALVLVMHADRLVAGEKFAAAGGPSPLRAFVIGGHTGVSLFFVLSAFLLSRPFLAEARGLARVDRRGYLLRRALRILPLYWTAVVVASVVFAGHAADVVAAAWPYLLFLNALADFAREMWPFSPVWWSLATEAQFYLLLPLLPLVLRSRAGRAVGLVLLGVYVSAYVALAAGWLRPPSLHAMLALAHSIVGRGPLFAAGIAAAVVYDRYGERVRAWASGAGGVARWAGDTLLVGAVVGLGVLLRWTVAEQYVTREAEWPLWHAAEGPLWAVVVLALLLVPGHLKPLFANRAWAFLGLISYSIYLVHFPVLFYGRRLVQQLRPGTFPWLPGPPGWTLPGFVGMAVLAAVAVGLATITYVSIERPALRLKTRLRPWTAASR